MEYRYRDASEMKDSGVEWIGKIPKDWEKCKWGYVTNVLTDYTANGSFGDLAKNVKYLDYKSYARLIRLIDLRQNLDNEGVYVSKSAYDYLGKSSLHGGEFLMANVGANAGFVCEMPSVNYPCTLAPNMMMAKFNENLVNNNFMIYSANSYSIQLQLLSKATQASAQPKLNKEDFKTIIFALPYIKEQEKIANFLDKKTSQFDSIISKKEALIEKLEEAKKSLISEVVTGKVKVVKTNDGYDLVKRSSYEMKDSGVEWLGEIPNDWEVKRIKYLFKIKKNIAGKLGYDVLSVTQSGIKIKDITKNEGQLSMDYSKYQIVDIGDFVMNHMDLLTGFVDYSKYIGVTSPDYRVFRLLNDYYSKNFYNYIFQFCYYNKIFYSLGQGVSSIGRWRLQTETFKNFILPKPPIREQEELVKILECKIKEIEMLKNKLILNIQKLKEAKQSLISEAVTGKIEILD